MSEVTDEERDAVIDPDRPQSARLAHSRRPSSASSPSSLTRHGFVIVGSFLANVLMRYVFGGSIVALEELQWHLYAFGFMVGLAYALVHDQHVRGGRAGGEVAQEAAGEDRDRRDAFPR